jgi:electron transport complex protein RnfA
MASVREHLELASVPRFARGSALVFMIAGMLSLAFMGFGGLLSS